MSRLLLPGLLAITAWSAPATAQVKASEPATLSQTVDGTVLSLEYSRPRVRGRDSIFGAEVKWDEVWTPGANWATTLEVSKDVKVNGHPLAKGKYSVWMVVRPGAWTVVFDPRARLYHTKHPDSTPEQVRFDVRPEPRAMLEVLTWSFPEVRSSHATLAMEWERVRVPLDIEVPSSYQQAVPAEVARRYVGSWSLTWSDPGWGDTTAVFTFEVSHEGGALKGVWTTLPWPEAEPFLLLPVRDKWFALGMLKDGELYEVWQDMTFEFRVQSGRAQGYELRGEKDALLATGARR